MIAPRFRTSAITAGRRRHAAPPIERATFVLFSLAGERFATAVEHVERVLRHGDDELRAWKSNGRVVDRVDLAAALTMTSSTSLSSHARTLVFSAGPLWLAATVDAVYEVATIDVSTIAALPGTRDDGRAWPPGARGGFVRHDQRVIVIDVARALGL